MTIKIARRFCENFCESDFSILLWSFYSLYLSQQPESFLATALDFLLQFPSDVQIVWSQKPFLSIGKIAQVFSSKAEKSLKTKIKKVLEKKSKIFALKAEKNKNKSLERHNKSSAKKKFNKCVRKTRRRKKGENWKKSRHKVGAQKGTETFGCRFVEEKLLCYFYARWRSARSVAVSFRMAFRNELKYLFPRLDVEKKIIRLIFERQYLLLRGIKSRHDLDELRGRRGLEIRALFAIATELSQLTRRR